MRKQRRAPQAPFQSRVGRRSDHQARGGHQQIGKIAHKFAVILARVGQVGPRAVQQIILHVCSQAGDGLGSPVINLREFEQQCQHGEVDQHADAPHNGRFQKPYGMMTARTAKPPHLLEVLKNHPAG